MAGNTTNISIRISEATLLSYQMKENGSFHLLVAIILLKQSMIIFASCYSHAIFLTPAMALVCMIFGIHSQFIHWKNNFLMGMIPW